MLAKMPSIGSPQASVEIYGSPNSPSSLHSNTDILNAIDLFNNRPFSIEHVDADLIRMRSIDEMEETDDDYSDVPRRLSKHKSIHVFSPRLNRQLHPTAFATQQHHRSPTTHIRNGFVDFSTNDMDVIHEDSDLRVEQPEEKEEDAESKENGSKNTEILKSFAYLKRIAGNSKALEGRGGIILQDGTYSVSRFVHTLKPVYKVVPVTWISKEANSGNGVGYIQVNDSEWDGSVPIMHATRSNVRFYGCCLDPEDPEEPKITCKDGGMFDFNYTKAYKEWTQHRDDQEGHGGCRIERHNFAHIETPLDREGYSGVFILGKLLEEDDDDDVDQEYELDMSMKQSSSSRSQKLALTAFIIARGQTLFVPPNTIHTNDYQRGLWRTYLEVDDIDICDLIRLRPSTKHPYRSKSPVLYYEKENISLKFYCGLTKRRMAEYELPTSVLEEKKAKGTDSSSHSKNFSVDDSRLFFNKGDNEFDPDNPVHRKKYFHQNNDSNYEALSLQIFAK
jgi:hypothetical protein